MRTSNPVIRLCVSLSVLFASAAASAAPVPTGTGLKPFAIDRTVAVGDSLTLQSDAPDHYSPGWYMKFSLPGRTGADAYRENISGSSSQTVSIGDIVEQKMGNMVGPTRQGVKDLIAQDPDAYWDETNDCVVTQNPASPRIAPLVVFDPADYAETGVVRVAGFQYVFFEAILGGSQVVVRGTTSDPDRTCPVTEPKETSCTDGLDNDGDGAIDCNDSDCNAARECAADINVSAIPQSLTASAGQAFVRGMGVINPFNFTTATVTVADRVPLGASLVSIASAELYLQGSTTPVPSACSVRQTENQTEITCTSLLESGKRMDIVIVEAISARGVFEHRISASSDRIDPNPADNEAVFTATVE